MRSTVALLGLASLLGTARRPSRTPAPRTPASGPAAARSRRSASRAPSGERRSPSSPTLDPAFDGDGFAQAGFGTPFVFHAGAVVQPDGDFLLTGAGGGMDLARFTGAGSLDTTFGTSGVSVVGLAGSAAGIDALVQPDGRIVTVGSGTDTAGIPTSFAIARAQGDVADLPANLELVGATPSQGSCDAAGRCSLGSLAAGRSATVTVPAAPTAPPAPPAPPVAPRRDTTPPRFSLSLTVTRLGTVVRAAKLRGVVKASEPATVTLVATIPAGRKRTMTIATGTVRFAKAGSKRVALTLTSRGKTALRRAAQVRITLGGGGRDAAGNAGNAIVSRTLKT